MFAGHAAVALAAKGTRPSVPIAVLLLAAFAVDLFESALWVFGVSAAVPRPAESVPVTAALAASAALAWGLWRRDGVGAALVGLVALSHLPLDLVSGRVGLWPGAPVAGLMLFERPVLDGFVEGVLAVAGWALWRRSLPARSRRAPLAAAVLAGLLLAQAAFLWVLEGG